MYQKKKNVNCSFIQTLKPSQYYLQVAGFDKVPIPILSIVNMLLNIKNLLKYS